MTFRVPNWARIKEGPLGSDESYGNNGAFFILLENNQRFQVIASDGGGWEHVSVTRIPAKRCPTWLEMCEIKAIFWDETDTVIQYHPSKNNYVNNHPNCLHLWRPIHDSLPTPEIYMV